MYRPRGGPFKYAWDPGPNWQPASKLHDSLSGRPVIVMGQAYSLNQVDLEKLKPFITFGCNRCLRPDSHVPYHPDYYVCVDRDPYAQELERIRKFEGVRVLSEMLFDRNNLHKKTRLRTHWAPLQPLPDFPWYGFRAVKSNRPRYQGMHVYTTWQDWARTMRNGIIPTFGLDLDLVIAGAANVAYSMFQIAAAFGASVIGIVGVDLAWQSNTKTHSFADGDGKKKGAFSLNPRHTLPFFRHGVEACRRVGVEVFNLSPAGVLSPTVPRLSEVEFHKRFAQYARGDLLYPRKFEQSAAMRHARTGQRRRKDNRYKPASQNIRPDMVAHRGLDSSRRGRNQAALRKARAADLARARRRGRRKDAGT